MCNHFQICVFCKKRGASIGCCSEKCKKSFHLPCALNNQCTFEFVDTYRSFCNLHYTGTVNPSQSHEDDEKCAICTTKMGEFHPSNSMQFSCCSTGHWYHKSCLRKMAFDMGRKFKCPRCGDVEQFQENLLFNGIFIPTFTDETSNADNDADVVEPNPKKRRLHKNWLHVKTFDNKSDALAAINEEKCWSYYYDNHSAAGKRVAYRCNMVKLRGIQCAASAYLLYDSKSDKVFFFRSDSKHTHDSVATAVSKFTAAEENVIRELMESGLRPKSIKYNLVKKGIRIPAGAIFNSILMRIRHEKFGRHKLNPSILEKWLQENQLMPDDETDPFVLKYEIDSRSEDDEKFRFFVTSKLLLKSAVGAEKLHCDVTYKLNWNGFPVLLIGTTDLYQKFHVFGISVCRHDTETDFVFLFAALKNGLKEKFNVKLEPKYLISDATKNIHNAFQSVFGENTTVIMCWFHMRKAVKSHLEQFISDKGTRFSFWSDLDKLQASKSTKIFDQAANLFVAKWTRASSEFMDYFTDQWLRKNRNWYEASARLVPSTNNSLESFNRLIKDEHTLCERADFSQFRVKIFETVKQWSTEYDAGLNSINNDGPNIDLKMWTLGYQWAKSDAVTSIIRYRTNVIYRVSNNTGT